MFQTLNKLDAGIKEFIDVGVEMTAHSQSLDTIHQKVARGELVVSFHFSGEDMVKGFVYPKRNVIEQYENQLKEQVDEYAAKTARQKYAKDARYLDFHSSIWVCLTPVSIWDFLITTPSFRKFIIPMIPCPQLPNLFRKVGNS